MITDSSEYRAALKRERDRELRYRETAQGAFESSFIHVDYGQLESIDMNYQTSWLSDCGAAMEHMLAELDDDETVLRSEYNRKKRAAAKRLKRNMPDAVPVFLLICRYGSNRKESIRCLMTLIKKRKPRKAIPEKRNGKLPNTPMRKANILDTSKKC